ncbi:MAG: type II toxin-antitoxin system VapC family toxin [Thermoanaerobaculia bacterium]
MYLLDTNVISELRKPRPHGAVVAWVEGTPNEELYLSAVTLGELQAGVEITRDQDPEKAREIESWIDQVAASWNVLPLESRVFRTWGRLMHRRSQDLLVDGLVAATALVHHLIVVTRNVGDFRTLEVETFNPFDGRGRVERPIRPS